MIEARVLPATWRKKDPINLGIWLVKEGGIAPGMVRVSVRRVPLICVMLRGARLLAVWLRRLILAPNWPRSSPTLSSGNVSGAVSGTEITTVSGAQEMIDKLTGALDNIGELRGQFGANINRLNHTANNLANIKDNTEMARGRIMDADFASESAMMSKNSMLMQSGISMLKQTGQMPSMVMSLLG